MFKKWDKQSVYFGVKTQTLVFRVLLTQELTLSCFRLIVIMGILVPRKMGLILKWCVGRCVMQWFRLFVFIFTSRQTDRGLMDYVTSIFFLPGYWRSSFLYLWKPRIVVMPTLSSLVTSWSFYVRASQQYVAPQVTTKLVLWQLLVFSDVSTCVVFLCWFYHNFIYIRLPEVYMSAHCACTMA